MPTDAERMDFLQEWAKGSPTGVSIDWTPSVEGQPSGYRFMWRHHIGKIRPTARAALDEAIADVAKAKQLTPS